MIGETPTVKHVIYDGDNADPKALEKIRSTRSEEGGVKVLTLDEVRELGKKQRFDPVPPKEDGESILSFLFFFVVPARFPDTNRIVLSSAYVDTCCIMYTSGSTGAPKGVILSHKNICASVAAVHFLLVHVLQPSDTYVGEYP